MLPGDLFEHRRAVARRREEREEMERRNRPPPGDSFPIRRQIDDILLMDVNRDSSDFFAENRDKDYTRDEVPRALEIEVRKLFKRLRELQK